DGRRIVSIDVQKAGAGDLLGGNIRGRQAQTIVPAPEHGAFAGRAVDDDIGGLSGAVFAHLKPLDIDAGVAQAVDLDAPAAVVTDRADIAGPESKGGAGDDGAGHLPAWAEDFLLDSSLAGIGRKTRDD